MLVSLDQILKRGEVPTDRWVQAAVGLCQRFACPLRLVPLLIRMLPIRWAWSVPYTGVARLHRGRAREGYQSAR